MKTLYLSASAVCLLFGVGCISMTNVAADGSTQHFALVATNAKSIEYNMHSGTLAMTEIDQASPARELVKTAGMMSALKTLTGGVTDAGKIAVEKLNNNNN